MVDEGLDGDAGSSEAGDAAHAVRVEADDFVEGEFLLRSHGMSLVEWIYLGKRVMAQTNRQDRDDGYIASGHPSVEQLMGEQGTGPITDVCVLHGDFWPEEESIEDFLSTLREWRGRARTDRS